MRTRPWPLILLAIFQILSPLGTILFNSWALGVKPIYVLSWILERPPLKIFESLLLMPIAGVAIYQMKAWSYAVFFIAMIWSMGSNLANLDYATKTFSVGMIILIYAFQVGLAIYFMIPAVRKTYLDARVRWWEAKRRYNLRVPVSLEFGGEKDSAQIENISEGGVLIQSKSALDAAKPYRLRFDVLGVQYEISSQLVYAGPVSGGLHSYGFRFLHTAETIRVFKRLMSGLELVGVSFRDQNLKQPWYLSVWDWAAGVFKTGKGLVPDVKSSRKA